MSSTGFPSGWDELTIKKATILLKDGSHGTHKDVDGGIPLLSAKDIRHGRVWFENDPRHISSDDFNQIHKNYKLCNGDVLLTIVGTLGRIARVQNYSNSYTLQRSVAVLRFDNSLVDSEYAYYLLTAPRFQADLKRRENRGAQGGVYLGEIAKIKVLIPGLPMQRNIVQILNTWDKCLANLDKKIAAKKHIKKGLMQRLLSGKVRLPGFNERWTPRTLGAVSNIKTGKKDNKDKVESGEYPFFVRSPNIERINSYSFDGEAILIPGEGNIGKIFHYINGKFDFHQRVYKISNFDKDTNGKFIYYLLSKDFANHTKRHSVKATVDSLRLPTFKMFEYLAPNRKEQDAIADVLSAADEEIELLSKERGYIAEQRKFLLNGLINGKIRVPESVREKQLEVANA